MSSRSCPGAGSLLTSPSNKDLRRAASATGARRPCRFEAEAIAGARGCAGEEGVVRLRGLARDREWVQIAPVPPALAVARCQPRVASRMNSPARRRSIQVAKSWPSDAQVENGGPPGSGWVQSISQIGDGSPSAVLQSTAVASVPPGSAIGNQLRRPPQLGVAELRRVESEILRAVFGHGAAAAVALDLEDQRRMRPAEDDVGIAVV